MTVEQPRGERIAKLLARAGVASRREIERMIAEGRIKLGEAVLTTPATVLTTLAGITVDGKPVQAPEPPRLFAFHKPEGLITTESDPRGRPTIYVALRNALPPGTPRVMPVGRLDLGTEGLLLLTNDGELKRAMELPSSGVVRTYRARTFGAVTQARLEELIEGIEIEGVRYGPINANLERRTGRNQWVEMTITEGKNREVRRVLEHLGLQVSRLIRVGYGPFALGTLGRGQAVEIAQKDVERFRKDLRLGPGTVAGAIIAVAPAAPLPVAGAGAVARTKRPPRVAPRKLNLREELVSAPRRGAGRGGPRPDDRVVPPGDGDTRPAGRRARRIDPTKPDDVNRRKPGGGAASGAPGGGAARGAPGKPPPRRPTRRP